MHVCRHRDQAWVVSLYSLSRTHAVAERRDLRRRDHRRGHAADTPQVDQAPTSSDGRDVGAGDEQEALKRRKKEATETIRET